MSTIYRVWNYICDALPVLVALGPVAFCACAVYEYSYMGVLDVIGGLFRNMTLLAMCAVFAIVSIDADASLQRGIPQSIMWGFIAASVVSSYCKAWPCVLCDAIYKLVEACRMFGL